MPKISREKSQINRNKVIETAYQLFVENGYHATSMRQIADRAGITLGGIYNHFSSKEDLWVVVFIDRHPLHQILPLLQHIEGGTTAEIIHNAASRMVTELGKCPEVVNLMLIEIVEFKGAHMTTMFEAFAPGFLQLGQLFAQESDQLRDIPLPSMARAFAGLFFSYYMTTWIIPAEYSPLFGDRQLDDFINIYLHGILSE